MAMSTTPFPQLTELFVTEALYFERSMLSLTTIHVKDEER